MEQTGQSRLRGTLPDKETETEIILLKCLPLLYLTYQIKLQLYFARKKGMRLAILMPSNAKVSPKLNEFQKLHSEHMDIRFTLEEMNLESLSSGY